MAYTAKNVMCGTWGQVWLDGELVSECYGLQAKVVQEKEDVPMCGDIWGGQKVKGTKGTGSLRMNKVNSRMARLIGNDIRRGKDPHFTIISKLADPDAHGTERVAIKEVSFDDLTLADWEARSFGKVECPFTFSSFEYLDTVEEE